MFFWRERGSWPKPRLGFSIWLAAAAATLLLAGYACRQTWRETHNATTMARNFYGALRVEDVIEDHLKIRQLNHGTITHGVQIMDPLRNHIATTYYGRDSGIGLTWRTLENTGPLKLGVIGLGAGTLAAYGRAGDTLRFYDINPLVVDIAKTKFTFLSDSPAHSDIVLGDARLSLAQEVSQQFDILVIDAFSGDAIPVHLLTREAFQIYWRHLKPDGVLAVHISNRYLDLAPIVTMNAKAVGKPVWQVENDDDDATQVYAASYILISSRPDFFNSPLLKKAIQPPALIQGMRPWTDDFTNLWQVLKFGDSPLS